MRKLYSQLIGMPVHDAYSPSPIALVQDVLIDPENGKVLAFLVKRDRIVVPMDVSSVNSSLTIEDRDRILHVSDVLRVQEIARRNISLLNSRVFPDKEKLCLGRVVDFEIDMTAMVILNIFVAKTFFFFQFQERIFSWKNIVRIEPGRVIVKNQNEVTTKAKAVKRSEAFA